MIGVAPAIGWWLGRLADRKFGTDWVFQAIGVALGLGAAVRETVFLVRRAQKDLDE
jgi:F0F1-type ATP synthase assembly protein I